MEESEISEGGGLLGLPPPSSLTVAIAINGNRKSKSVVKWALEKFVPEGNFVFKLLHVRPRIIAVPTPMGNSIPLSRVRDDVAAAYRKDVEWQTSEKLLPCKKMCIQKKVRVEIQQIESDDIVDAISREVSQCTITKLVIGASSRGMFSRGQNLSSKISECIPGFCTVYAVSKGKLSSLRPSDSETNGSIKDDCSETSSSTNNLSSNASILEETERADPALVAPYSHFHYPSLPMQRFQALSTINQTLLHSRTNSIETISSKVQSLDTREREDVTSLYEDHSDFGHSNSEISSFRSLAADNQSWLSDRASTSSGPTEISSDSQGNFNFDMEKLRIELRHVRGMYALAQNEAISAARKVSDLQKRRLDEEIKLKGIKIKEVEAKELAIKEKERHETAKREAEYVKECAEREAAQRKDAEMKASREAKEREKLENALVGPLQQYHNFTWEELVSATSSFSENLRIGTGANGTVYKCSLHHTTAAVKVLHSREAHRNRQFEQELEILSRIRHPHLLSLLGACPDHGCLVYEYMENGSLEETLLQKNNAPPLPWFTRFQIAWEIASTLVFLHNAKPKQIIHRDLKPANILLDRNFVSKIGDVGLSMMLHSDSSCLTTICNDTGPVGTLCYIDPEYQRTGMVSPKSDVYAFGLVILQLLTGKPAMALAHAVETAMEDDCLSDLLDPVAGKWPIEETKELARLGLQCSELRRRDRPDLRDQVLPALDRLKVVAARAREAPNSHQSPPNHFICPILKDIMDDPYVAADGYTYDCKAIEIWLKENDTSPMTNLPLPSKTLTPNYTLLSAIMEWKSGKQ